MKQKNQRHIHTHAKSTVSTQIYIHTNSLFSLTQVIKLFWTIINNLD